MCTNIMKKFLKIFTTTKLTIILLFLLIIAMFLGTLFPQGGTPWQYQRAFGETWYNILSSIGLLDVFHSWWYITLGILLLLNLLTCHIYALCVELHKNRKPEKGGIEIKVSEEKIKDIAGAFRESEFRYKQIDDSFFIARKGMPKRLFSIIFHLFLALLSVGFFFSAASRFDGMVYLHDGETCRIPYSKKDSLNLTLEKFDMEYLWYNDSYFAKDYKSTIVLSTGQKKTIEVNKPLTYNCLNIYQFNYDQEFDLVIEDILISVKPKEYFRIPGINGVFKTGPVYLGTLFRDNKQEKITPNTKLYFMEMSPVNVRENLKEKEIGTLVLGEPFEFQNLVMEMRNVEEISGLFYRKDTGYPILFYTSIAFMIGLFIRVFFSSYELRIYIDKSEKAIYVTDSASGIAARLDRKIDMLKNKLTNRAM